MDMRMFTSESLFYHVYLAKSIHFLNFILYSAHSGGNKKATWTEQEEEELRRLFMENQANPETDEGN